MEFPKSDKYIDYAGDEKVFHYSTNETPFGYVVIAKEDTKDGYLFEAFSESNPLTALNELRKKIKRGLAIRYIQERDGTLYLGHDEAEGYISSNGIVIDGKFISFQTFVEMLQTYEGSGFSLKVMELDEQKN